MHDNYHFLYVGPDSATGQTAMGGATRTLASGVSSAYDGYLTSIDSGERACDEKMECIMDGDCPSDPKLNDGVCPLYSLDVDHSCALGQCTGCDSHSSPCTRAMHWDSASTPIECPAIYDRDEITHTNLERANVRAQKDQECWAGEKAAEAGYSFSFCLNLGFFSMCDECLTCKGKQAKAEEEEAKASRASRGGRRLLEMRDAGDSLDLGADHDFASHAGAGLVLRGLSYMMPKDAFQRNFGELHAELLGDQQPTGARRLHTRDNGGSGECV